MTKATPKKAPAKAAPPPAAKAKAAAPAKPRPQPAPAAKAAASKPAPEKGKTAPVFKPAVPAAAKIIEADPETKAIVLNARKRKSTPAIFKIRSRKNTPIVFTLDDVREIIKNRRLEKPKAGAEDAPVKDTPAVAKPAVAPAAKGVKPTPPPPAATKPRKSRTLGAASLADILGVSSPPKTQKAVSITQMMDDENIPQKWRKYYRQLVDLREKIRQGLDLHTSETLKRSSKEDSGDLSGYSQHMADAGTTTFDRDFALSLVSSEQELLYEIEEALKRMRNNSYGICEITATPISSERLAAVPFTRYSLEGQKELEKQRRFGTQRGTAVGVFGEATTEDAAALAEDDAEA
ncbi:MAG: transcriptional regulator [Opitutales bacterium]|jgi:RNA polymerase-binding transcription factor DksA